MTVDFVPDRDIPSQAGKVIFITGGTAGLGAGTVAELAKHSPAQILFSGRNQKAADALIARVHEASPGVELTFVRNDISSLASVKECAESVKAQVPRLDTLMLNAGVMATEAGLSVDGYETQFATNHLGHALLVQRLLPLLHKTAAMPNSDVRVINMSSEANAVLAPRKGIEFATLHTKQEHIGTVKTLGNRWTRYGQSKLAQLLYSQQLAKHHPDIMSISLHPGVIPTALFQSQSPYIAVTGKLMTSFGRATPIEKGHYHQCWAATCPREKLENGRYYEPIGVTGKENPLAKDEKLGKELWEWTMKELRPYLD